MIMEPMRAEYAAAAAREVVKTITEKCEVRLVTPTRPCLRAAGAPASVSTLWAAQRAGDPRRSRRRTPDEDCVANARQVLGKMLETSRVKLQSARDAAKDSVFEQTPVRPAGRLLDRQRARTNTNTLLQLLREMDGVFGQLQGTPVDPVMVGGERGKTLFDFIDAETVESLQQDALEQAKECVVRLGSLVTRPLALLGSDAAVDADAGSRSCWVLTSTHCCASRPSTRSSSRSTPSTPWRSPSWRPEAGWRASRWPRSTTSRYGIPRDDSRIIFGATALTAARVNWRGGSTGRLLRGHGAVRPAAAPLLHHHQRHLPAVSQPPGYSALKVPELTKVSIVVVGCRSSYEVAFAEVQLLFDELRSLRDFYRQFVASYERVGPELERRKTYEQQVAQTVRIHLLRCDATGGTALTLACPCYCNQIEDMRTRLAMLEDQEAQRRIVFCSDHDRFLPSTLCPEIKEMPRRFDVVAVDSDVVSVDEQEDFGQSAGPQSPTT